MLVIEGEVANVSDQVREIPPMRAELRDAARKVLRTWTFKAGETRLLPGESVLFSTRVEDPAAEAAGLSITFTKAPADARG